jgi:hypothetical protein
MRGVTRGITILSTALVALAVALPAAGAEGRTIKGVLVSVSQSTVAFKDARSIVTTCARTRKSPSLDGVGVGDRVQAACAQVRGRLVLVKIRHLPTADAKPSNNTPSSNTPSSSTEPTKFGGVVTALSGTSITVHDGDRDLTCSLGANSPSTEGVKVGQGVKIACANGALVAVSTASPGAPGRAYEGTVTAVGAGSITVHNDKAEATCTITDGSPSIGDVNVGDRVLIGCKAGSNQLLLLKKLGAGEEPPSARTGAGTVSALSPSSVTFHNAEHGDLTCSVGPTSPSVAAYKVGDNVKFGCLDGALVALAKDGSGTADGPHKSLGAVGSVSTVSATSLTVHTDGGDVTCSVADDSPSVTAVHAGDNVKIGCLDGVLRALITAPAPVPPTGEHRQTTTVGGTLSVVSDTSVTVHSPEKGDVTCTVGATSPRLGDFHVGDHVGMACVDGVVAKLVKL